MQCTKSAFRCSSRQSQGPVTDGYYNEIHILYTACIFQIATCPGPALTSFFALPMSVAAWRLAASHDLT